MDGPAVASGRSLSTSVLPNDYVGSGSAVTQKARGDPRAFSCVAVLGAQQVPNLKFSLARATKKSLSSLPMAGAKISTGGPPVGVNPCRF
jgi:hypothetical protein